MQKQRSWHDVKRGKRLNSKSQAKKDPEGGAGSKGTARGLHHELA